MKFSDLISVGKTIKSKQAGWHYIEDIQKELQISIDNARKKVSVLIRDGRVEEARLYGTNRKVYRIIK